MSEFPNLRRATASDVLAVMALQREAYADNRALLGVEPLPLQADYAEIIDDYEVWLAERTQRLEAVLILQPRDEDLLIWSVATAPSSQGLGLGSKLLSVAESRAAELGRRAIRLYTGEKLTNNVAWYRRHGYAVERVEQLPDRSVVHMVKQLS